MQWLLAAGHTEDVPAESHPGATLPSSFTNQTGTVWTGHGGHSAARKKEASSWLADGCCEIEHSIADPWQKP